MGHAAFYKALTACRRPRNEYVEIVSNNTHSLHLQHTIDANCTRKCLLAIYHKQQRAFVGSRGARIWAADFLFRGTHNYGRCLFSKIINKQIPNFNLFLLSFAFLSR